MPCQVNYEGDRVLGRAVSAGQMRSISRYVVCPSADEPAKFSETAPLSHSHVPLRHLLSQIESDRSKRANRDIRPEWLSGLIEYAAELFEPLTDVGRVGFDCQLDERGWSVAMYLGAVESVGGKDDGHTQYLDFRFDLPPLLERFTRVNDLSWSVFPMGNPLSDSRPRSFLLVDGLIGENRVRLAIHSTAPETVGPGLRRLPSGQVESV